MDKILELENQCFKEAETKLKTIKEKTITPKEYKKIEKQIGSELQKKLKQIRKQYPIKKEIQKFFKKD